MSDLRVSFPKPCEERWEEMRPAGCHRLCARCDKVIHDLSQLDIDEVQALLRRDPDSCVRASIGADGVVGLKTGRRGKRKMVLAAAATATLLAAPQPSWARQDRPTGIIAGTVESFGFRLRVTATGQDGRAFRVRIGGNGRYRIRHVPAGTYTLTFAPSCGESWTVENVIVGNGQTNVAHVQDPNPCIVVGLLRIEDGEASQG